MSENIIAASMSNALMGCMVISAALLGVRAMSKNPLLAFLIAMYSGMYLPA
jgi:hypothetical protein